MYQNILDSFLFEEKKKNSFITFSVIIFHILAVYFSVSASLSSKTEHHVKKIVVRTVSLKPQMRTASESKPISPPSYESVIEEEVLPVKQEIQIPKQEEILPVKKVAEEIPQIKEEVNLKPVKKQAVVEKAAPTPKKETKKVSKSAVKPAPSKPKTQPKAKKQEIKKSSNPSKIKTEAPVKKTPAKKDTSSQENALREKALKEQREKQQALISQALSSLDKASSATKESISSAFESTQKNVENIKTLQAETAVLSIGSEEETSSFSPQERSYYDELISRLKLHLRLPEYGEVKVKLTLSSLGKVIKVSVTSSKNRKNKDYVEKTVPKISFPQFGTNFQKSKEHTFSIRLTNEVRY